jgi:phage portal protein BeeE
VAAEQSDDSAEAEAFDESEHFTATELAKEAGVRPQMVYNYLRAQYIAYVLNPEGKYRIRKDVANAWIATYKENKAKREQRKVERIAAELEGRNANEPTVAPPTQPAPENVDDTTSEEDNN